MILTSKNINVSSFLELFIFYVIFVTFTFASGQDRKEYIVYMGDLKPSLSTPPPILHSLLLEKALDINSSSALILHSYKSIFNGFVGLLTKDGVQRISAMKEVVSIFPNGKNYLCTTRSWDFINFPQSVRRAHSAESRIIVGILDTGIWPELDNFNDNGLGPPPSKWKGSASCIGLTNFTCNRKIIGARYYKRNNVFSSYHVKSPRDTEGHGTYIASLIAGSPISSANFFNLGRGTARGGVPSSRIAVYKVCWSAICEDADIIAAFEDAVNDGVDIISISLGKMLNRRYLEDASALGSFQAMRKGILTTMSGGNRGPKHKTVGNVSPWVLTVAASTIDRKFTTSLRLGNGMTFSGLFSINAFEATNSHSMVFGGNVPNRIGNISGRVSRFCELNTLEPTLVKDKIVICDGNNLGEGSLVAGAAGMVLQGDAMYVQHVTFSLPAIHISEQDANDMLKYVNSTSNPTGTILKSTETFDKLAPYTPLFSSRGPNTLSPQILKPDLAAPGVTLIGAWLPEISPTGFESDKRRVPFNIFSGTSFACPHAVAAAAYVKSFHPSWSPASIKSALMTTASTMSIKTSPEAEFAYGAGQINPASAINPGLVYDANLTDYVQFLCGQGYTDNSLKHFIDDNAPCTRYGYKTASNLNLPTFAILMLPNYHFKVSVTRIVTNVGLASSTYTAKIDAPPTLKIEVVPSTLSFSSVGQTKSFTVNIEGIIAQSTSASLSWIGYRIVRSAMIIFCRMG